MGVFGDFVPPKCDYSSSRPRKGTSLRKSASFKLSTVKIRWGVWPIGELTESVTDTHAHTEKFIFCLCIALARQKYTETKLRSKDRKPRTSYYAKNSCRGPCSVGLDRTVGDAPPNVCLSRPAAWTDTPEKRTENNLIVRSEISEAETTVLIIQEAQLSQRGRSMLRVCL